VSGERTPDEISRDIHRQRDALAASVAMMRRDVRREIADKREFLRRQIPRAGAAAALLVVALATRRALRKPDRPKERFRLGRFAVVERN
jgi:hypothetical protein